MYKNSWNKETKKFFLNGKQYSHSFTSISGGKPFNNRVNFSTSRALKLPDNTVFPFLHKKQTSMNKNLLVMRSAFNSVTKKN